MFRTLMVPLDGFPMSEQAIDHAVALAQRTGARIQLVHVLDLLMRPPYADEVPPSEWWSGAAPECAVRYIERQSARVRALGVQVSRMVREPPIVPSLLSAAESCGADLIIMTTHGRGPLGRLWLGSVADEVGRKAPCPVLFIRAAEDEDFVRLPPRRFKHLVVPLDGSELSEDVLAPAVALARLDHARLSLIQAVHPTMVGVPSALPIGQGIPFQPAWIEPGTEENLAREYLNGVAQSIASDDFKPEVEVLMSDRSPADEILDFADRNRADLVALATHARGGLRRLLLGSISEKTVRGANTPVLVLRQE